MDFDSLSRRQILTYLSAGGVTLGTGKAVDNTIIGYGAITGTNLTEQDFTQVSSQPFPQPSKAHISSRVILKHTKDKLVLSYQDTNYIYSYGKSLTESDLPDSLTDAEKSRIFQAKNDYEDLYNSNFKFKPQTVTEFFDTLDTVSPNAITTDGLRGTSYAQVQPKLIQKFTGIHPKKTKELVYGLAKSFRQNTFYDVPRYLAGSVQDNILFGVVDLREPFRSEVSFEKITTKKEDVGMFCYEFTWRSIEALHSVPASKQTPPVFAATVIDDRHKHVYTLIGSVYRDKENSLIIPLTFVDYTHVVLYDDINGQSLLGNGLNGYNTRHRATDIWWHMPD